MPNIKITVAAKIATNTTPGEVIVCGNSDYTVTFSFDSEWDAETARTARFVYYKDGLSLYQDVAFTGTTVAVPVLSGVSYVLVGVYAGNLRTTTPAKVLCDRSILCGDPLEVLTPEEKAALQAQIGDLSKLQTTAKGSLVAAINELHTTGGSGTGGGLSQNLRTAIYNLLMDAAYLSTGHESDKAALAELLTGSDTGGEDSGGEDVTYYTIEKNLSNVTISNGAASVAAGSAYSATLTAADGYTLGSVTVTMGGEAVTVANGVISIEAATGNIVITATATADESGGGTGGTETPDTPLGVEWTEGLYLSTGNEMDNASYITSDYVAVNGGTTLTVTNDTVKLFAVNTVYYDAEKAKLGGETNKWCQSGSETYPAQLVFEFPEGTEYVRVSTQIKSGSTAGTIAYYTDLTYSIT